MRKALSFVMALLVYFSTFAYVNASDPYREGYIEGYIKNKIEDKIQIEAYDGTLHTLSFAKDPIFIIDNRDATIIDFKPGMEVYATLEGRKMNYIESYSTENLGYIKEGSRIKVGTVKRIDRNQIILKPLIGKEETYFTSPATVALKNGKNVELNTLYEGDRVKLYFDEMDSTMISKMSIEGQSILINNLYRGKISISNDIEDSLTLEDVEYFKNGQWEKKTDMVSLSYNNEIPIYIGGQKIPSKNLKNYKGKTAYLAVKDFFGKDKIEKFVIKSQYESAYSNKIEDINWYSESFELSNKQNLTFNEGTIIIKNERLVDKYSLTPKTDAFILADGRGSSVMADVVYVYNEDINNSNIGQNYVYTGKLDKIDQYSVVLDQFYILDKNEWVSFNEKKDPPLYYDEDTYIYDLDNSKKLTVEEFMAGNYSVDENSTKAKEENLKDHYSYIYADGDRIHTIFIQKNMDSLLKQRITNGSIESIENNGSTGWTLSLKDAKDWSEVKDQWMPKNTSVNINLEKAMVIKDGKRIEAEELQAGEKLYIVRDDYEGKIIIVK